MLASGFLWPWLIHATVLGGLVLGVGSAATVFVRQPADRLRLILLILLGCLIAPWLGGLSSWQSLTRKAKRLPM